MNATGCPNWLKVADTARSDALHSITYGLVLSGLYSDAFINSCFKL